MKLKKNALLIDKNDVLILYLKVKYGKWKWFCIVWFWCISFV